VLPGVSRKVAIVEAPILEISSKQIRHRIGEGKGYRYYLRDAVYQAISETGLYK
jgi:nicotinic acid mononucleotide adenylyltransferase